MGPDGFVHLRALIATLALTLVAGGLQCLVAQSVMLGSGPNGAVYAFGSDEAILESQDVRKDLACTVDPIKPVLGFDLRFHSGYEVTLPLKEVSGPENLLTIISRVTYDKDKEHPVYFSQHFNVPKIQDDARGEAYLEGAFDVGEGDYHVDWLMRDRSERVCSFYWDSTAALTGKDKEISMHILSGSIESADKEPFRDEPPVSRDNRKNPLTVKVMVNFAPQRAKSATLQPLDTHALISILRNISREPRIIRFSVVAFNMQEQRILFRQEDTEQINFPALGDSLNSLNLGTVDLKRLVDKHGDTGFLSKLISDELSNSKADAVIFASPKVMLEEEVSQDSLKQLENFTAPVFYMNYNLYPQTNPWRDAIGVAVKRLRGFEYTISRPRDLSVAWSDIVSRIIKQKGGTPGPPVSSQN